MQNAEDAQAGYTCHFQNKHAARSSNEVKEDMKGARTWQVTLIDKSASRMYFTSSFSYAYGKDIVSWLCSHARHDQIQSLNSLQIFVLMFKWDMFFLFS